MQVVRKCRQCLQVVLKVHPPLLFDYQCPPKYYCIKLLQTTPNPTTIHSGREHDAEAVYNSIQQFILAEGGGRGGGGGGGGGDEAPIVPAGWVLSMVQRSTSYYDIKLLIFLLLKHHLLIKNPDPHLTQEITRACLRCGALLYAKSTIDNHNTFGFTPNKGSALLLLNYAEDHDDIQLMHLTLQLLDPNNNPDVAEITFRIYRNVYGYNMLLWVARQHLNFGLKLNQSTLEMLMESAVNNGDVVSLREFEDAISKIMNRHTFRSGFAYAKGLLLDDEPEIAANVIIQLLRQFMVRDAHNSFVDPLNWFEFDPCNLLAYYRKRDSPWPEELMLEIQKLVKEWPAQIINLRTTTKRKKERIATLKFCIPKMVKYLSTKGFELNLDLGHLNELGH